MMNFISTQGRLRRSFAVAGALAAASALAAADDAKTAATSDVVVLSPFTVSSDQASPYGASDAVSAVRVRAPLIDTPSSITVLTRDMIDDLQPSRIFDVTRYSAGVQDGRGIQFQDRMIIRGFETQNGARTVDNFLQSADADNVDPDVIDRIEITKGPNAILSPAGAPGGSVNVITKSPFYGKPINSITGQIGMFDSQKLSLDMGGPFSAGSPYAYRLVASWQDSERYWASNARLRGAVVAPMFGYRLSDRTQLTVKLIGAQHWIFREPLLILDPSVTAATHNPFPAPGIDEQSLNGIQPWSSVRTHSADLFTTLTTTVNENLSFRGAVNLRYFFEDDIQEFLSTPSLTTRYNPMTGELTQDYTWAKNSSGQYVPTFSPFFDPHNIPVRGDWQDTRKKTANVQFDMLYTRNFSHISSQTVAGGAFSRQTASGPDRSGSLPGIDLSNPGKEAWPVWSPTLSAINNSQYTNWELYLNERLGFFGDKLYVTGGILHYDTYTNSSNGLTPNTPAAILKDSKDMGNFSVLWKALDYVSLYYSHSNNSSPVIANNQPLWRSGVQDEAGFKSEFFKKRVSFTGAYFEISQTNVTVPNPDHQTDPNAPQQLISDLKDHGVEFELMGGITPDLSVVATYSQLHLRDNLGRRVRAVADRTASLLLNYRVKSGDLKGLATYAGVSYVGSRPGDTPNPNFTPLNVPTQVSFYLKPYYSTTVGLSYHWEDKYMVRFNIDNVLDDHGYLQQAGGRVSGTGLTTAPGINVKLSLTYYF
jgi:iron complex outermembrane receptor protein